MIPAIARKDSGKPRNILGSTGGFRIKISIRGLQQTKTEPFFLYIYIRGSVHRNSGLKKSNEMQQYADIYLLLNYSTCFGRPLRPSS